MLISTAEVTGAVMDSDRGCRSQIRTRVSDAEKWLQNFTAGLHRVIFYGDHVRDRRAHGPPDGLRNGQGDVNMEYPGASPRDRRGGSQVRNRWRSV